MTLKAKERNNMKDKKANLMVPTNVDWLVAAKSLYDRGELSKENYLKIKQALDRADVKKEFEVKWFGS
jgi:hypothetical protein